MTSEEIIIRVIEFREPERIGLTFTHGSGRINDMVKAEMSSKLPDWKVSNKKEMWQDEWGNIWMRANDSSKGEVKIPALKKVG